MAAEARKGLELVAEVFGLRADDLEAAYAAKRKLWAGCTASGAGCAATDCF